MTDFADLDELLEAPYKKEDLNNEQNGCKSKSPKSPQNAEKRIKEPKDKSVRQSREKEEKKHRSRSRSRGKKSTRTELKEKVSSKKHSRDRSPSHDKYKSSSRQRDRPKSRSRDRSDRRSDKEKRPRSRDKKLKRSKSRSKDRKSSKRSRSPDRISSKRSISKDRRSSRRSRSRGRDEGKKRSPSPSKDGSMSFDRGPRPRRELSPEYTPEERDARTVFVWQLAANIRQRDLEEFFSAVGKIRDVRLISDNKTRRSKGIAYVEFRETTSVPLALALTGTKLLGVPIQVQASQAEKNRVGQPVSAMSVHNPTKGPLRLYVGSLHYNITEEMLRGIFEPFGPLQDIRLIKDPHTNVSQGYGFLTYYCSEDARKALEQLNGFELAGRPMKVNTCNDRGQITYYNENTEGVTLDNEDLDKRGLDLGASGRLALMAKLAEGTGLQVPNSNAPPMSVPAPQYTTTASSPNDVSTQCFMLSNMFNPSEVTPESTLYQDIREDVIEECTKHGGIQHFYLDPVSPEGNVYAKCTSIPTAIQCVNALHGRYFSGRLITAAYVPLTHYHKLFPDSEYATAVLSNSFN